VRSFCFLESFSNFGLLGGSEVVSEEDFINKLISWVRLLKRVGLRLDGRLILENSLRRYLRDFRGYCLDKHILEKAGTGSYLIVRNRVLNTVGYNHWENPVQYSSNELRSLQEVFSVSLSVA